MPLGLRHQAVNGVVVKVSGAAFLCLIFLLRRLSHIDVVGASLYFWLLEILDIAVQIHRKWLCLVRAFVGSFIVILELVDHRVLVAICD